MRGVKLIRATMSTSLSASACDDCDRVLVLDEPGEEPILLSDNDDNNEAPEAFAIRPVRLNDNSSLVTIFADTHCNNR